MHADNENQTGLAQQGAGVNRAECPNGLPLPMIIRENPRHPRKNSENLSRMARMHADKYP
ncbi:MAG: hypothetical protein RLZZ15_3837 [Verrucomicrobiota bacterium]